MKEDVTMFDKYVDPPSTNVESSKGNFGLSYKTIFSKVNHILKTDTPIMMNHAKATKLLYIAKGIKVDKGQFQSVPIAALEALIVHDMLESEYRDLIFDVAQLDNKSIIFIFKNNLVTQYMTTREKFINLYSLYDALVAMYVQPELCVCYNSIYNSIARYAPYVLTIKNVNEYGL